MVADILAGNSEQARNDFLTGELLCIGGMMHFFSDIGDAITKQTVNLAEVMSTALSAAIVPIFVSATAVMLLFYGFALVRGEVQQPFSILFGKVIKLLIIISVVRYYYLFGIIGLALSVQNDLVYILTNAIGTPSVDPFSAIDQAVVPVISFFGGVVVFAISMFEGDSAGNITIGLMVFLFLVLGGGVVAIALFYAIVSILGLVLILGLGPLFIAGLAFGQTAKYFDSWISSILSLSLSGAASSVVLNFITKAQISAFKYAFPNIVLGVVLVVLLSFAFLLVMLEVPRLISQLTQGGDVTSGVVGLAQFRGVYNAPWFSQAGRAATTAMAGGAQASK
ncbi:type IV secretion system protein [Burkholderia territorii]|uniref:type IV secretion system protein n=1 Tax=Burkholderia territorii TaxID=1503055 RepID=UPI0009C0DE6A|nr:type IV secretion system protein [Burkholderia territorii]